MDKQKLMVSDVPHMAAQWDYEKNTCDIETTPVANKKICYWKCKKCTYSWSTSPVARYRSTGQCPCCDLNKAVLRNVNDLFTVHPEALDSYDFTSNDGIDPYTLSPGSHTSVHWKCSKCGYEWDATVKYRSSAGYRCPCCETNKVIQKGINDVFTIVPELKESYDFDKNAANTDFDIYQEGIDSSKKTYWLCAECGRSWSSTIRTRIKKTDSGYSVVSCPHYNTVKRKREEIPTVSELPALMKFWDYDGNLMDPQKILSISEDSVAWICRNCGYQWSTSIRAQSRGTGKCLCCEQLHFTKKGFSDLFTILPEAEAYYNFEKNPGIDIYSLGLGDKTPLWWKCPNCSHEWQSPIANRISRKDNKYYFNSCQQCYLHDPERITPVSSKPALAKFWNFKKNKAIGMDINLTSTNSPDTAFWRCPDCGYEWESTIKGRSNSDGLCPHCDKGIGIMKGVNDILSVVPDLASIYDWDKNKDIDIYSIRAGSIKNAFWKCPTCQREWESRFCDRVTKEADGRYRMVGCSVCDNKIFRQISYAEEFPDLEKVFNVELNQCSLEDVSAKDARESKYWWDCPNCHRSFFSLLHSMISAVKSGHTGCPYCSSTLLPENASFADIHPELMDEYSTENTINPYEIFPNNKQSAQWICRNNPSHRWEATFALRHASGGNCPICNESYVVEEFTSFAAVYPDYVSMWSENNDRSPKETFYNSSLWLRWVCPECAQEYGGYIADVVSDEESCPHCKREKALATDSLQVRYPELAAHWSSSNEENAAHVFATHWIRGKWICFDCGGEYNAYIPDMVSGEANCPYCNDRLVLPGFNSFAARHKDLVADDVWDYTNNYLLADPDMISESCITQVWWFCKKDPTHRYTMTPKRQLYFQKRHRGACPYCKGLRRTKYHFV